MPEIAVFGEWDTTNLGDRAIHENVVRFCAECGWGAASYAIGSLSAITPGKANGSAAAPGKLRASLGRVPHLKSALRGIRQRVRMRALLAPLRQVQAIVVGGGELLSDWDLHFPQSLAALADAARELGKPVFCLGCGAEGAWSSRAERKIRQFLTTCTLVATRDETTAERIAQVLGHPVAVFGDFCLGESAAGGAGSRRPAIAVNVQQMPAPWNAQQERYEAALVALAGRLIRSSVAGNAPSVRVFTTGSAEDSAPAQRVFGQLSGAGARLLLPGSLGELFDLLDTSAFVIASRLHAGILALDRGAAVVGFSPHPKLRRVFSTLGIGDYGFDLPAADQLVRRLEETGPGVVATKQRECVMRAPIWSCRTQVREKLKALAGADSGCK